MFGIGIPEGFVLIGIFVFFIPTYLAIKKQHPQKIPIILVNIIGGLFYGIGWIVALVWVFIDETQQSVVVSDEILKLNDLKEKNIITEDEFNKQKQELLK